MKNQNTQDSVAQKEVPSLDEYWVPKMPIVLHALANKLLPIMAFSDLGSRRCDDPQLREYFDKIRQAAVDSREFINQLRQEFQQNQPQSQPQSQKNPSEPIRSSSDDGPVS